MQLTEEFIFDSDANGLWRSDFTASDLHINVADLEQDKESRKIKFEPNALLIIGGCNCGKETSDEPLSIAEDIATRLNISVIAGTGDVYPETKDKKETGQLMSSNKGFVLFQNIDGKIQKTNLGKTINPSDYQYRDTIEPVDPVETIKPKP